MIPETISFKVINEETGDVGEVTVRRDAIVGAARHKDLPNMCIVYVHSMPVMVVEGVYANIVKEIWPEPLNETDSDHV